MKTPFYSDEDENEDLDDRNVKSEPCFSYEDEKEEIYIGDQSTMYGLNQINDNSLQLNNSQYEQKSMVPYKKHSVYERNTSHTKKGPR